MLKSSVLSSKFKETLPQEIPIVLSADDFKKLIVESASPDRRPLLEQTIRVEIKEDKIFIYIKLY